MVTLDEGAPSRWSAYAVAILAASAIVVFCVADGCTVSAFIVIGPLVEGYGDVSAGGLVAHLGYAMGWVGLIWSLFLRAIMLRIWVANISSLMLIAVIIYIAQGMDRISLTYYSMIPLSVVYLASLGDGILVWDSRRKLVANRPVLLCRRCGYSLLGLREQRCPECGEEISEGRET